MYILCKFYLDVVLYRVCQWPPITKNLLNAFCTRPLNVKLFELKKKKSFEPISTFFEMNKLNENNLEYKSLPSSKYLFEYNTIALEYIYIKPFEILIYLYTIFIF